MSDPDFDIEEKYKSRYSASPTKPAEDSPKVVDEPDTSGVITIEDRLQADPDAYTLEPEPEPEPEPTKPIITSDPEPEPTVDPYANVDETEESTIYVSRSTYDKPIKENLPEPVQEHPIQEHTHLVIDDLVSDDPEMNVGEELADIYQSHSTYVLEPTPPKETHLTKSQSLDIDDISPDDKGLIDESAKKIYESQSTYDIGEMGSVILEAADKFIERAKKTARETKIVSHSRPTYEFDDLDDPEGLMGDQLEEIYDPYSTYEVEKTVDATGLYLTGLALSGGVSFVRGAVATVNPLEWARGLHDLTYLTKSRYAQKQFVEHIAEDPLRFVVDTGSAIAGSWATGKLVGKIFFDTPDELKYDLPETELSRVIKRTDGRISTRSYEWGVKQNKLQKIWTGWDEIAVSEFDDLGSGFSAYNPPRGAWPTSGTKGFGITRTGHDVLLTETLLPPTTTIYRPRIDYLSGFKRLSPSIPDLIWLQTVVPGQSLSAYPFMGLGAVSSLSSGIAPDIDDPLGIEKVDTILESIPTFDDTGLYEVPRVIERVDETYRQERKLISPLTTPRPETIVEPVLNPPFYKTLPIIDPILDEDTDITTITIPDITQIQEPVLEQKQEPVQEPVIPPIPILELPTYTKKPPRKPPKVPLRTKKRRRRKRRGGLSPLGYEMREYKLPPLGESKSKGGKLPSLDIPSTKTKKSRRKLPKL